MKSLFNAEPAAIITTINAAVVLLIAFGVNISQEQKVAIGGLATALCALWIRSKVTPV